MKYVTNFSRGCFHHWPVSQAVIELVQNWLDSDGERSFDFGEGYIELTNSDIKVSNKLLMMGKSDKRDDPTKRGCFGVGSIQSMVVLTDLDIKVTIKNNDVMWEPRWEYCDKFEDDIMVIDESPCNNGTRFTVTVEGLSEVDIDEVKQRCLAFQDRQVLYSTEYGDIIENIDGEGEVFCGDLYVCQNSAFKYSYNFKPKGIKLSQDRDAVSQWDMSELTAKLIIATKDDAFIKEAIRANKVDTAEVNSRWGSSYKETSNSVNDSFAEEFLSEHGAVLVTDDYSEHQTNEKLGNKSVYISNSREVRAIQRSELYKEAIMNIEYVEKESFDDLLTRTLDHVEALLREKGVDKGVDNEHISFILIKEVRERLEDRDFD